MPHFILAFRSPRFSIVTSDPFAGAADLEAYADNLDDGALMLVEIEPNTWATIVTMFTAKGTETNDPTRAAVVTVRIETRKGDDYRQIPMPAFGLLHSVH